MNQKIHLKTEFRNLFFILLFPIFFILPFISCTNSDSTIKAPVSDSLAATTPIWATWYVKFKTGTSEPIRELSMYYFEKALMDSLNVFKHGLDRQFNVGFQRNHDPFIDTLNYQIKVGFSEFGATDTSKLAAFSKISLGAESVSIPFRSYDQGNLAPVKPERVSGLKTMIILVPLDSIRIIKPGFISCVSVNAPCLN
jgi:hypothetical protein